VADVSGPRKRALFVGTRFEACRSFATLMAVYGTGLTVLTFEGSVLAARLSELPGQPDCRVLGPSREAALGALRDEVAAQTSMVLSAGLRYIVPAEMLAGPTEWVNSHPHLLPGHEGINAIRESFDRGESEYGVTVHRMTAEVDAGDNICRLAVELPPADIGAIYDLLFSYVEPAAVAVAVSELHATGRI